MNYFLSGNADKGLTVSFRVEGGVSRSAKLAQYLHLTQTHIFPWTEIDESKYPILIQIGNGVWLCMDTSDHTPNGVARNLTGKKKLVEAIS